MFEYIYRKARMNTCSSDIFDSGLVPRFWCVSHKKSQKFDYESWIRGYRDTPQLFFILSNLTMKKTLKTDFFHLVMSMGQRKNFESPWGIEPQTFGFCTPMPYYWAIEAPWWARSITKFIYNVSCILLGIQQCW